MKRNMGSSLLLLLPNTIPTINGSCCNRVIKSSYKKFFHLSQILIISKSIAMTAEKNMKVGIN